MIRTRWLALHVGYQSEFDLPWGFSIGLFPRTAEGGSRYRFCMTFGFALPQFIWYDRHWHANEVGYLAALPVLRAKPKRWLLRGVGLPITLRIYIPSRDWEWTGPRNYPYIGSKIQGPRKPEFMQAAMEEDA
jgi:hypothetical protein